MGKNFRETLNERMQDPAFRTEWDVQEPERQIMRAIVEGREENGMTQKQLSDITGITQADISRLESGTANPSADAQASCRRHGNGTQAGIHSDANTDLTSKKCCRNSNCGSIFYLNVCSSWSSGLCPIASRLRCNSCRRLRSICKPRWIWSILLLSSNILLMWCSIRTTVSLTVGAW